MTSWTYEGYWNTVLGAHRSAADVVQEVGAEGCCGEWLGDAEAAAWSAGGQGGDMPEEWSGYHERALAELCAAAVEVQA